MASVTTPMKERKGLDFVTPSPVSRRFESMSPILENKKATNAIELYEEQKSTISALSSQVEILRQREERYKKEIDMLTQLQQRPEDGMDVDDFFQNERDQMKQEKNELALRIASLEEENFSLKAQVREAEQSLQGFSDTIDALEKNTNSTTQEMQDQFNAEKLQLSNEIENQRISISELQRKNITDQDQFKTAIYQLQNEIKHLQSDQSNLQVLESKNQEILKLESQLNESIRNMSSKEAIINSLRVELDKSETSRKVLEPSSIVMSTLKSELDYLRKNLQDQFSDERHSLLQRLQSLHDELSQCKSAHQKLQIESSTLESARDSLIIKVRDLEQHLASKDRTVQQLQNDISEIQQCRESIAGSFASGFKELLDDTELRKLKQALLESQERVKDLSSRLEAAEGQCRLLDGLQSQFGNEVKASQSLRLEIQHLRSELCTKEGDIKSLKKSVVDSSSRHEAFQKIQADYLTLQRENMNVVLEKNSLSERLERYMKDMQSTSDRLCSLQKELSSKTESEQELTRRSILSEQQLKEQSVQLENYMMQVESYRCRFDEVSNSFSTTKQQLESSNATIKELKYELKNTQENFRIETEEIVIELRQRVEEANARNLALDRKLQQLLVQGESDQEDMVAIRSMLKQYKQTVERQNQQLLECQRQLQAYENEMQQWSKNVYGKEFKEQMAQLTIVIDEKNLIMAAMEKELQILRNDNNSEEKVRAKEKKWIEIVQDRDISIRKLKSAVRNLQRKEEISASTQQEKIEQLTFDLDSEKHTVKKLQLQLQHYENCRIFS